MNLDKKTKIILIVGIGLIILALIAQFSETEQQETQVAVEPNQKIEFSHPGIIDKDTFNGQWAFNADSVEVYCANLGDMYGYKVKINGQEYSIANVKELPYLPNNLWKDVPMENNLCLNGAYSDGDCKVYLDDTIEYAKTLCQ